MYKLAYVYISIYCPKKVKLGNKLLHLVENCCLWFLSNLL